MNVSESVFVHHQRVSSYYCHTGILDEELDKGCGPGAMQSMAVLSLPHPLVSTERKYGNKWCDCASNPRTGQGVSALYFTPIPTGWDEESLRGALCW